MKLIICFNDSVGEFINYFHDNIRIMAQSPDNIQAILIDEDFKNENLKTFRNVLEVNSYTKETDKEKNEETLKDIETVEKALKRSFILKDFDEFEIIFENIKDFTEYTNFLEKLKGNIIIHVDNLSKEDLNYLKNIKFQNEPQVNYGLISNNIDLSEYLEILEIINSMETFISKFALSEIEKQLLLFDLVRERVYKSGDSNDKTSARDLNRVLKEEEIVCAGYANIFAAVSNQLGIPTIVKKYYSIKNPTTGHASNVSYVYDSIYNDYYILEYDPTWNSRKNEQDQDWINNYDYAAVPENIATLQKYSKKNYGINYSMINTLNIEFVRYHELLMTNSPLVINWQIDKFVRLIINIYKYLNKKDKVEELMQFRKDLTSNSQINPEYIQKLYEDVRNTGSKSIPIKDFIKMIYRVRRVEHSIDPQKYPLDYNIIENIVRRKYNDDNWKQYLENLDVLNNVPHKNLEDKIKYDAKMMELIYALREINNNKKQENSLTVK
ncbi:MAG: hypothetical protein GX265_03975 [Mollicutes bacterium]|nr:hypothetical protein [Mollicutes bacterium]